MIRTVLAVTALAVGASAVVAQGDPIAARKALMKANGDQSRIATEMLDDEHESVDSLRMTRGQPRRDGSAKGVPGDVCSR